MTIDPHRLFQWNSNQPNPEGEYVLYWMQIQRRLEYNFGLDYAVEWANKLRRPLLIYEGLRCDYPWASDRFHQFILQGMEENRVCASNAELNYFPYAETKPGEGRGLVRALAEKACMVITDDFPAFIIRSHNQKVGPSLKIPFVSVDSNGIIPLGLSKKAPYSAYEFRRLMQKNFVECYNSGPQKNSWKKLKTVRAVDLNKIKAPWPDASSSLGDIPALIAKIPLDHSVTALDQAGTREAALKKLSRFIRKILPEYSELRNDPDFEMTSGLSPYLHFGKISSHEVVKAVLDRQPERWSLEKIDYNNGSRDGFFNGHPFVDAFLDQVITWRETGYHYCHHVPNYDQYESLPAWVRATLRKHESDKREFVYSLQEWENAATHDALWNAAQNQLRREGVIHNYLRMVWGKKILEWSADPQTALQTMIHLNNKYSIDGRNPNSYTGIFWILGRFDRPWGPERPVFGSIRYMSSESTKRKVKVKEYLRKYA